MTKRTEIRLEDIKKEVLKNGGMVVYFKVRGNLTFMNELEKMIKNEHWHNNMWFTDNDGYLEVNYLITTTGFSDEINYVENPTPEMLLVKEIFNKEV